LSNIFFFHSLNWTIPTFFCFHSHSYSHFLSRSQETISNKIRTVHIPSKSFRSTIFALLWHFQTTINYVLCWLHH
jgi:hypothetical protein